VHQVEFSGFFFSFLFSTPVCLVLFGSKIGGQVGCCKGR